MIRNGISSLILAAAAVWLSVADQVVASVSSPSTLSSSLSSAVGSTQIIVPRPHRARRLSSRDSNLLAAAPTGLVMVRGGAGGSTSTETNGLDLGTIFDLAKSVARTIWNQPAFQEAARTSPVEVVTKVGLFLNSQRNAALKRQKAYRQSATVTAAAITSPQRALRLTLVAFCVAELLQFLETHDIPATLLKGNWNAKAETISTTLTTQWENFYQTSRAKGGLLQFETWTNRVTLSRALQDQVHPKYQWALGAAVGFVLSPLVWSWSWTVVAWSASLYLVAETHHLGKTYYEPYYETLQSWNHALIFAIDDTLEDVRKFVNHALSSPMETLLAIRDDIDERIDFDFPPRLQKGLIFGAIVGVISGL